MNPTNAVTYQLHLIEAAVADAYAEQRQACFSSGAAQADNTNYIRCLDTNDLPTLVNLAAPSRIWYKLKWSGAPGNTTGYIVVMGYIKSGV